MNLLAIPVVAGLTCIGAALYLFLRLRAAKISSPKMSKIGSYIAIGVRAYLSRQLRAILLVTPVIAIVLGFTLDIWIAVTFVLGVFTSLITAYMGMSASTRANVKTADDATRSVTTASRNGLPLFPVQPNAGVVTLALVNQLRDGRP